MECYVVFYMYSEHNEGLVLLLFIDLLNSIGSASCVAKCYGGNTMDIWDPRTLLAVSLKNLKEHI